MDVKLTELSLDVDEALYQMALEIGPGENGFVNGLFAEDVDQFQMKVQKYYEMSKGHNLEPQYVPQTTFWFYVNGNPVGYGKLRHYLNDKLVEHGGHIGYVIKPSERKNGYGKLILRELIKEAARLEIDNVLLTCDEVNISSRRIIEANGGVLSGIHGGTCKYWIRTCG